MSKKKTLAIVAFIVLAGFIGVYAQVNPANSLVAPKCLMKMLTGYDCPSCGGQRALHALLNGEISKAFWFNPFLFVAVPYLFAVAYSAFSKSAIAQRIAPMVRHPRSVGLYLILYFAWWIIRNTPLWQG